VFGHERSASGITLDRLVFGCIIVSAMIGIYAGWLAFLIFIVSSAIVIFGVPYLSYRFSRAQSLKPELPLQIGTKVMAVCNFGPVKDGAPGVIIGLSQGRYLCAFADNMKIAARPNEITDYDHGYSLEELEEPDFAPIMHEHKKRELLSLQRQVRPPHPR
jgi:hypothetical protein